MSTVQEVSRPAFPLPDAPLVSYGRPFAELCRKHVGETFKVSRIYVLVSRTLASETPALEQLQDALGEKIVGIRYGMKPHTLFSECYEVIEECRRLDADFIIVLGAGSLTDAAKLVAFALGNNIQSADDLIKLPYNQSTGVGNAKPPKFPFIAIPTSLSGGEYSVYSGATRDSDHCKVQFSRPCSGPKVVILDPELALHSPIHFWLSTGVRAIDHCTEALSGLKRVEAVDKACVDGLKQLIPGLLNSKTNPSDPKARFDCMLGVCNSMAALNFEVFPGASHGIGHNLGPLGVGHANVEEQKVVVDTLWTIPEATALFEAKGLKKDTADLGDLLDVIFRALEMPRTLTEMGIGRDKFDMLSKNSLADICVQNNPAPLDDSNVREILEMCL